MSGVKGTVSKEILRKLLLGGAILIAGQSPYFWFRIYKNLFSGRELGLTERKVQDVFYYLKKKNLIDFDKQGKQLYISLTPEGEKEAGKYQLNKLKIETPKKWDHKWRVIIFDVPERSRVRRDAFRGKLKEFGFYAIQKSVWAYPYPCQKEINLLREFFNIDKRSLKVLEVDKMEEDRYLRDFFNL